MAHPPHQPVQFLVVNTKLSEMVSRIVEIFSVRAASTYGARYDRSLFFEIKTATILHMIGINHVSHRLHPATIGKVYFQHTLEIGRRYQFAFAQIAQNVISLRRVGT